jgi:hypothetical protein
MENTEGMKEVEVTPIETQGDAGELTPAPEEITIEEVITPEGKIETKAVEMTEEQKKFEAENQAAMLELEAEFGLTKKQIQVCMDLELFLSNPKSGVTTLIGAMQHYKSQGLTEGQMLFMSVNANSRANMFRNDAENFHTQLGEAQQQIVVLMKLAKMNMPEVPNEAVPKPTMEVTPTGAVDTDDQDGSNIVED